MKNNSEVKFVEWSKQINENQYDVKSTSNILRKRHYWNLSG